MPAAEAPPKAAHRFILVKRGGRDVPGSSMIVGVPGGPPKEEGIVLCLPPEWAQDDEIVPTEVGHPPQAVLRKFMRQRILVGTPRFQDGVEIGLVGHCTDTGIGQPFVESTFPQVSPDQMDRLEAYAHGRQFLGMWERNKIAKETQDYRAQHDAYGEARPDAVTPEAAQQAVLDDRTSEMIDRIVAERLEKALVKAGLSS